jgi:glucuronoarabinoxylan endo-1,4-beta-xylanase
MNKFTVAVLSLLVSASAYAANKKASINIDGRVQYQHVTGFGGFSPSPTWSYWLGETEMNKLFGKADNQLGLNVLRLYIANNKSAWSAGVANAKNAKKNGAFIFASPWSPPASWKTNNSDSNGGELLESRYEDWAKFLNSYYEYMKEQGVEIDAVSIQNEPDWNAEYQSCIWTGEKLAKFLRNYGSLIKCKIIAPEAIHFTKDIHEAILNDEEACKQLDIVGGHFYGWDGSSYPLAAQKGKEVWMTEHSVTDNIGDRLPTWQENLIFAEELNECMLSGCTGYIYWYLRAHWAFCGTGETKYGPGNKKDELLPRAFVMSHFSKNVTGSTRLQTSKDADAGRTREEILQDEQFSAYQKGDSIIVMAINARETTRDVKITLPYHVRSGELWLSTGNETANLCQKSVLEDITESTDNYLYEMPAQSLSTFIFMIDNGSTAIANVEQTDEDDDAPKSYYDLQGRRLTEPHGLCIERSANGRSRKVVM